MELGYELIKEQLFFRKELMERIDWFIRLRWMFAAAGLAGCALLRVIQPQAPILPLTAVFLGIAAYNAICRFLSIRLRTSDAHAPAPFIRLAHVQICLDLSALCIIIYLTGGLFSPVCFFAIFHVLLTGLLLSSLSCYSYTGIILGFIGLVTLLQGIHPAVVFPPLFPFPVLAAPRQCSEMLFVYLIYALALLITAGLSTSIKKSLRIKGRELLRVSKELESSNKKLTALYEMVQTMGRCKDLQALMDAATRNAAHIMGVKGCSIKVLDEQRRRLRFTSAYGLSEDYMAKESIDIHKSTVNRKIIEGMAHVVGDIQSRDQFQYPEDIEKEGIAAMVCLPLRVERMIFGVFCVYSGISHFFNPDDIQFFERMSDLTALAMENLKSELNKTWFLHKSAHQLRAPLNTLTSVLKTISGEYLGTLDAKQKEALLRCERRIDLLGQTVGDLLELSIRRSRGKKHDLHPMDVADLLNRLLPDFRSQAGQKNITIELDSAPGLPRIAANVSLLDDLLMNLISNALKYTPAGGKIRIAMDVNQDGRFRFRIADTGIGIAPQHLPHLFSEFYRAPNAKQHTEEGTGLGLVIVKEILDQLKGVIFIDSREGEGTEVQFLIPAIP